jgi:polysaccharide deacetylase 2 family uncharacterized protein YibQ
MREVSVLGTRYPVKTRRDGWNPPSFRNSAHDNLQQDRVFRTTAYRLPTTASPIPIFPPVKSRRRILLFSAIVILLIAAGIYTTRWLPGAGPVAVLGANTVTLDSAESLAWHKANPWLFADEKAKGASEKKSTAALVVEPGLKTFRENFLLPLAVEHRLVPRSVRRRGTFTELTFPRGRPIHAIAYDLEQYAAGAGFRVTEGREVGAAADQVEYMLVDAAGNAHALRIRLGEAVVPGNFRMAVVILDWARASAADQKAWLDFPVALTLVLPDTLETPDHKNSAGADRNVLVELPMEPSNYPYVKPGARALFIDHSRAQVEDILRARLEKHSDAAGFATKFGDRAIENPVLMENLLTFTAAEDLLFLDLTGSSRSLTQQMSLRTGAEGFAATAQSASSEQALTEDLERRATAAKRSGEGVWVLRHAPGLPAALARVLRAAAGAEAHPEWVTLRQLHRAED